MLIKELSTETFHSEIAKDTPVLVDFWAPWCGYCRRIAPALDKVAEQNEELLTVAKVNIDNASSLADAAGVEVIPTLILYRSGEVLGRIVAPDSKAKIDSFIRETLA